MEAKRLMRAVVLCLASTLFANASVAQDQPWIGRWASPDCSADAIQISLSRSALDLSTFETTCSVRDVRQQGEGFEINADCGGEEGPFLVALNVQVVGDTLTFTRQRGFEFDPKRFVRCGAAN